MKWLCLGTLQHHHPRQGLIVDSRLESDYINSCEYNGLGAHSYALSLLDQEVTEIRIVPFAGNPFQRILWSGLLKAEREFPLLKQKRLQAGFKQVEKKIGRAHV